MADPFNAELKSFVSQGFKPNDLKRVGSSLRLEIQERADQISSLSGVVNTKASLSGATFTGTVTVSGVFTTASGVNFTLADYADDTAASGGGIAIGQLYRNGSVVQVRVT